MSRKLKSAEELKRFLESLDIYGAVGRITMSMNNISVVIKQNDIIGNALQEWLGQVLIENDIYFRPPVGQNFPDFYLTEADDKNLCEMKVFNDAASPAFDIANFLTYINSLRTHPYRIDSDYLIVSYLNDDKLGEIRIKHIWAKKVWEIAGTSGQYPLNCQRKNRQIVNIRPIKWFSERAQNKPFANKVEFLAALYKTYLAHTNSIKDATDWLNSVANGYKQYNSNKDIKPEVMLFAQQR